MELSPHIVYVKTDDQGRIIAVNSSAFLVDPEGWTQIDSGHGDRFHHAQGNYFDQPIYDERGICRYRLVLGVPQERTQEDMDADYVPREEKPSEAERIAMLEEQNAMLTECVLEMSALLYA